MVTVYKTNNQASKKAIEYLENHNIEYETKSYRKNISESLIKQLFIHSIDGIDPLLAKKSEGYHAIVADLEDLKLSDLIALILKNPTMIKTPILIDDRHLVVGYSRDSIRVFSPRTYL